MSFRLAVVSERPNPLMQPANAGDAARRPRPGLPVGLWTIGFHKVVCS
jgi:hypothetical protein